MNIGAIGTGTAHAQQIQRTNRNTGIRKAMEAAAQTLGMNTEDLAASLKSGQSLSSLAQARGIDPEGLSGAVSGALTGADSTLSSAQAQEIAQHIIAGPQPTGPVTAPEERVAKALDAVAGALHMTPDQLRGQLRSGQSLTSLAAATGINPTELKTTVVSALRSADSALGADQADKLADQIIAGPPKRENDSTSRLAFDLATSAGANAGPGSVSQQALSALYSKAANGSGPSNVIRQM
jgi:hypothetical protein